MIRQYLWAGEEGRNGFAKVNRGGLVIDDLALCNRALLFKRIWQVGNGVGSL